MAQSTALAKEISVMRRLEAAMTDLPDDRARQRVAAWFGDNYLPAPEPPAATDGKDPT
jgi:hypothetical protein